jgi:two-component system chemotaxis sensor kinase CheA
MVRKVFHIEDSEVSRRYLKDLLSEVAPSVQVVPLETAVEAAEALERLPDGELPELILADHGLPGVDGTQFVSWVKMHPRLRSIPVVILSAETDDQRKKKLKALGVTQCLDKPVHGEQLGLALQAANGIPAAPGLNREAALVFTEEAMDRIGRCEELLCQPAADEPRNRTLELMRQLHTLKGNAFTYQLPVLGEFIHDLENFSLKAESVHPGWSEEARGILLESLEFARELVLAVREERPANLQRLDLMRAMARYGAPVANSASSQLPKARMEPAPAQKETGGFRRDGVSTRIPDQKLNELEKQLRKVLQAKNRLGSFTRMLSGEFPDEAFPVELSGIHSSLSQASGELMGFFMELRAVPLRNIRDPLVRILMEASERLQCEVDLDIEIDEHETIGREILDAIEMALVHTIRNAMDHGFRGRKTGNHLSVSVKRTGAREFEVKVRDNGCGLDLDALRRRVLDSGIIPEQALSSMPPERLLELAFIDGISIRGEADGFSGRGVGLGAVKAGIEKLGGKVSVWSEPGKGTEFIFTVPSWVST